MDKEIARYNLKPKDYKASCKRGYKIVKPENQKVRKKADVVKPKPKAVSKPKPIDKKRKEILSPVMKLATIQFDKQPKLLHPKMK